MPVSGSAGVARFRHLDGLRGLFAVSVAVSHIMGSIDGWADTRPLVGAYLAVDYFFILSGFVLAHMLSSRKTGGWIFFKKRLSRLWPLHCLTALLIFAVYWHNRFYGLYYPQDTPLSGNTLVYNLDFISGTGFSAVPMLNEPAWSISVEFWISAVLMFWLARLRPLYLLPLAVLAYVMVLAQGHGLREADTRTLCLPAAMLRGFAGITLGCVLYKLHPRIEAMAARLPGMVLPVLLVVVLAVIMRALWVQTGTAWDIVPLLAVLPFFAIGQSGEHGGVVGWLLSCRPALWFGKVSFPLYLVHSSVIVAGGPSVYAAHWGAWPAGLAFLCASLLAAEGLDRVFAKRA